MADKTAFEIYGPKARKEHITYMENSIVEGFIMFECDVDVPLPLWNKLLPAGALFLKEGEHHSEAHVYCVKFDSEQISQLAEEHEPVRRVLEDGTPYLAIADKVNLNVDMVPVETDRGHYLTYTEFIAWLAIATAETDEIREAIFKTAYRVKTPAVSAGKRQAIISLKPYQFAMTPLPNENCFIAKMTGKTLKAMRDATDAAITIDGVDAWTADYEQVKDLDLPLLNQLVTAAVKAGISESDGIITVDFNKFTAEMGKNAKAGKAQDLIGDIKKFEECVGVFPKEGKMQRVLTFLEYDRERGIMKLAVPYLMTVISKVEQDRRHIGKKKAGEIYVRKDPAYNELCHSTIVKERNKPAVSLVYAITNGLLQRGHHPNSDGVTEYRVKYRTLVEAVPSLAGRIHSLEKTGDKNKYLKRAFEGAFKILANQTDAYTYFEDLRVMDTMPPTMETLDEILVIRHRGIAKKDA